MQGACMVLNATWKLIKDHGVSMTPAFRRVAADFASRIADDVPPKTTGLLINSLAKLKGVAAEVPPDGWARIAQCVHRTYASVGDANFERDREKMRTSTEGNEGYIERFVDGGFEVGQFDGDELTATFQSVCACGLLVDQLTDDTWRVIANPVADFARTGAMSPDSVFATATSYNALRRRAPGALAAASDADLWRPLARCALDRLDDMNPIFVIHTLDAAKKLPEFRGALDVEPGAWGKLAKRLGKTAGELDVVNMVNTVSALGWMPSLASNMSDSGWHVVLDCLRQYEAIVVDKSLSLEAARSHGHDISDVRAAETKYAEKSLAGLLLIRAHEETYGTAVMAKIAECIERIEGKVDEETRAKSPPGRLRACLVDDGPVVSPTAATSRSRTFVTRPSAGRVTTPIGMIHRATLRARLLSIPDRSPDLRSALAARTSLWRARDRALQLAPKSTRKHRSHARTRRL